MDPAEMAAYAILRSAQAADLPEYTRTFSAIMERCKSNFQHGSNEFWRLMVGEDLRFKEALEKIPNTTTAAASLAEKKEALNIELARITNTASAIEVALKGYREMCLEAAGVARALAIEAEGAAQSDEE